MATMTTGRTMDGGRLMTSLYQYGPPWLLFDEDRWGNVPQHELAAGVGQLMPEATRAGWRILAGLPAGSKLSADQEREAAPTAR